MSRSSIKAPGVPAQVPVFILVLSYLHGLFADCPHLCECKWKNGKESVLCLNSNLSFIPGRLDGGTQVLDLTGNSINIITNDAFANINLTNLQKIFLAKCRLRVIEKYAFRKLSNLIELDLSFNLLTFIPFHAFDSIPGLREVKLNGNPIHKVANDSFVHVSQLVRLELSDCRISYIEEKAFNGLETSLEWLKLDGNKLVDIKPEVLTSFTNLHNLELSRNPWNCSCQLRNLRYWMINDNIPYMVAPTCKFPQRLQGKNWDRIHVDDFACLPVTLSIDSKVSTTEGENTTLSCIVEGNPPPNVKWRFKNKIIANLTHQGTMIFSQGRKSYITHFAKNVSNLTILLLETQDSGLYICAAQNKAGFVESEIFLTVTTRSSEAYLSAKILSVSISVVMILMISSTLFSLYLWSLKKRKCTRTPWAKPITNDNNYEKIEMDRKFKNNSFRLTEEANYVRPSPNNGIAYLSPAKRNGDYRNIPTEDEGTGGEDNESSICSKLSLQKRQKCLQWTEGGEKKNSSVERHINFDDTDLHIPRLIDFSSNADSGSSSLSSQHIISVTRRSGSSQSLSQLKCPRSSQMTYQKNFGPLKNETKKHLFAKGTDFWNLAEMDNIRLGSNFFENEKPYPDLIDISRLNVENIEKSISSFNAFCTLPRKDKHQKPHCVKKIYDSQSPLLSEFGSKFNSDVSSDSSTTTQSIDRRLSAESSSSYHIQQNVGFGSLCIQRSNSSLNLIQTKSNYKSYDKNPSLPTSPIRSSQKNLNPTATPLLDFSSLTKREIRDSPNKNIGTYDYHAAQLERFLEEYRHLQKQLCKMKETCESMRKDNIPILNTLSHSTKYSDPVEFSALLKGRDVIVDCSKSKTVLTNASILQVSTPDPPPYWIHRNNFKKRLSDS